MVTSYYIIYDSQNKAFRQNKHQIDAAMAELVDARDSKSRSLERSESSILSRGTNLVFFRFYSIICFR